MPISRLSKNVHLATLTDRVRPTKAPRHLQSVPTRGHWPLTNCIVTSRAFAGMNVRRPSYKCHDRPTVFAPFPISHFTNISPSHPLTADRDPKHLHSTSLTFFIPQQLNMVGSNIVNATGLHPGGVVSVSNSNPPRRPLLTLPTVLKGNTPK